jgi:hypothetical protein
MQMMLTMMVCYGSDLKENVRILIRICTGSNDLRVMLLKKSSVVFMPRGATVEPSSLFAFKVLE